MSRIFALILCLAVAGCASNGRRIDALASAAQFHRTVFESDGYSTLIYVKGEIAADSRLIVFLEGDGRPWRAGLEPHIDPTTSNPLALELAIRTPGTTAYLSRPCYHRMRGTRCSPEKWTGARYAEDIVLAMAAAAREAARKVGAKHIVLVGYSGGGTLATLIAERLESTATVITIAANLDIDAWARHHRYLPLSGSLNPSLSRIDHPWLEIHLAGVHDKRVPPETAAAYFERYPNAQRWLLDHEHVCCWSNEWEALWQRIEAELGW